MSAVAGLLNQKEQLLGRLATDPGPNERAEIQALLAKIETALRLLGSQDSAIQPVPATSSLGERFPRSPPDHDEGSSSGG